MSSIQHTVSFSLKHDKGSEKERLFLSDAQIILSTIQQVHDFQVLRQLSVKCDFDFCFSMVFCSQEDYNAYNICDAHQRFVRERWHNEVQDFLEQDFVKT